MERARARRDVDFNSIPVVLSITYPSRILVREMAERCPERTRIMSYVDQGQVGFPVYCETLNKKLFEDTLNVFPLWHHFNIVSDYSDVSQACCGGGGSLC